MYGNQSLYLGYLSKRSLEECKVWYTIDPRDDQFSNKLFLSLTLTMSKTEIINDNTTAVEQPGFSTIKGLNVSGRSWKMYSSQSQKASNLISKGKCIDIALGKENGRKTTPKKNVEVMFSRFFIAVCKKRFVEPER